MLWIQSPLLLRFNASQVSDICGRVNEIVNYHDVGVHKYVKLTNSEVVKNEDPEIIVNNFVNLPLNDDVVLGRDVDKALLINMILSEQIDDDDDEVFSLVSVVGMGGVGKTTLASLVYNDEAILSMFELRMWASMSARFHLSTLVSSLLETSPCLGGYDDDKNRRGLDVLQLLLGERIGGKKYLLVLDDAWTENGDDWVQLRRLLLGAGGARGSKVLVTTRSKMVPKAIGNGSVIVLRGLSDEDSWNLFKKVAFGEAEEVLDETLVHIGQKIVKKCLNLPLAIKVMGRFLKGQGTDKWLSLSKTELANISQVNYGIINVLKLSYDHLPSSLKTCFAYCSLFPKDLRIKKEKIIRLWMAQGFMHPVEGESLEDIGEVYFKALLQRNFFDDIRVDEDGEVLSCGIHGFIHDVAQLIAGGECVVAGSATTEFSRRMRHLCIDNMRHLSIDKIDKKNHCSQLY